MKHALTWEGTIRGILEMSEQVDLDVAIKTKDGEWNLVRADMVFPTEKAAKKYLFMRKLKKGS